ncbi:MAG: hypothetical protein WEA09_07720 [Gemmatimonadota bacterium]
MLFPLRPALWAACVALILVPGGIQGQAADHLRPPAILGWLGTPVSFRSLFMSASSDTLPRARTTPGQEFTDLAMRVRGRAELGGDWNRFRPCDARVRFTCDATLFPQLQPEIQFAVEVAGTVADRIFVDVDYDQTREFSGANTLNLYYQGEEGELLQRVELGDVEFRLPDSRFLTRGVPAGNFGVRAAGEVGPLAVQAVWAQQRGDISFREFQLADDGGRDGLVQEDTLALDDAEYVRGQFFFLSDPREIREYPHVDVLSLTPGDAPLDAIPGTLPIQLYRLDLDPQMQQQVEGYIQAEAQAELDGDVVREAGWFRYLQEGVDYQTHPSGLWVSLRSPLRPDELLAVTYVTAAGDTVGDYNPERLHVVGDRPTLRLLHASRAHHQPGRPTWEQEMRQIYRVSGSSEVEVASMELTVSLGEQSGGRTFKRGPAGEEIPLIRLFGLDEEAPRENLDASAVFRPAVETLGELGAVQGTFLVFPTLEPFRAPPPLPSLNLSAVETGEILGPDSNRRIYNASDPLERLNGGLFRLNLAFRTRTTGVVSTLSLGAFGIREGSERIRLGDRLLARDQDYIIDYDVGMVTLLDPETLLALGRGTRIRATWEQQALFQVAPTGVFGFTGRFDLAERGEVDFLGLFQSEQALVRRPQLGLEPASAVMGGLSADLGWGMPWLDRALSSLPFLREQPASRLQVDGEVALTLPNPNTQGEVYLDDFDGTLDRALSLLSHDWFLGSAPEPSSGIQAFQVDVEQGGTAAPLVWQHSWIQEGTRGDSVGVFEGYFPRQDIDRSINITGSQFREPGLRLTFGGGGAGSFPQGPRWRSVTTVLAPRGMDLSRSEFLEFYVADGDALTLVVDLGRVSEDAHFVDQGGQTSGVRDDGRPWGLGVLDQEADPRRGEIWNPESDARGVWVEACEAEAGGIYRLGDRRANCTRGNGRPDTEDLNRNGILDLEERHQRWVVRLDGSSPYLVRDRSGTGTSFRLYRLPLRALTGDAVGGGLDDADWRAIPFLRLTVAGSQSGSITLARMRLTGSRWVKRGLEGILQGVAGDLEGLGGEVDVTSVSAVSEGAAYQPPPGVVEELDDPAARFQGQGVEFNERALGIRYRSLAPGDRAEVYHRFLQRPRNFLAYRQVRLWAVGRQGEWGPGGSTSLIFKVGTDPENSYLYRTPLSRAGDPAGVRSEEWLPEVVVEFEEWLRLREEAELRLLEEPPGLSGPPVEVWSADSTYAVILKDRARAPNLAAVRELSVAVWNEGTLPTSGEVWVNELRLGRGVRTPGVAGSLNVSLEGGDLLSTRLNLEGIGSQFQQLDGNPTQTNDVSGHLQSTLALGRLAPEEWGLELPLTVSHTRTGQDPNFLFQTDLRAGRLPGLRSVGSRQTRVSVVGRRRANEGAGLAERLLGGLDARMAWTSAEATSVTSDFSSRGVDAGIFWEYRPASRTVSPVPGPLVRVVGGLLSPEAAHRVEEFRFRWTPESISLGGNYRARDNLGRRYDQIVVLPQDEFSPSLRSPVQTLEGTARVAFRPTDSFTAGAELLSGRDLLDAEDATTDPVVQDLIRAERLRSGGLDLGWETSRILRTRAGVRPRFTDWLQGDVQLTTLHGSDRNPAFVRTLFMDGDTVAALQRNVTGQREIRSGVTLDPSPLFSAFLPVRAGWQSGITSRFNRATVDPGVRFQLGWLGLDGFRFLPGDTAVLVTDRTGWNVGSGVRVMEGVVMSADFQWSLVTALDPRGQRQVASASWPDLRLTVQDVPLPQEWNRWLQGVSVSSGYQRARQDTRFDALGVQERSREDHRIPFDVTVRWGGSITTAYRGSAAWGDGEDPTGNTERLQRAHTATISALVPAPDRYREQLERPVRLTLLYQEAVQRDCRVPLGREECVAFLDQLNRSVNLSLDSAISGMELGLQGAYLDRRSFVGIQTGSTQFQLMIWGQFAFSAGPLELLTTRPGRLPAQR